MVDSHGSLLQIDPDLSLFVGYHNLDLARIVSLGDLVQSFPLCIISIDNAYLLNADGEMMDYDSFELVML